MIPTELAPGQRWIRKHNSSAFEFGILEVIPGKTKVIGGKFPDYYNLCIGQEQTFFGYLLDRDKRHPLSELSKKSRDGASHYYYLPGQEAPKEV